MVVGGWWANEPSERYWLEATDRADIGTDLRAPQLDGGGKQNWRYFLFKNASAGDVVLHYDKRRAIGGIVGYSRIAGPWQPARIVWGARGTFARARGDEPHEQDGYIIPLTGFTPLPEPLLLDTLRRHKTDIQRLLDALRERHGTNTALYFPFEAESSRDLRLLQGYAFKLPANFVRLFRQLAFVEEVANNTATPGTDLTPSGRRIWSSDAMILTMDFHWKHPDGSQSEGELTALSELLCSLHRISAPGSSADHLGVDQVRMRLEAFRRLAAASADSSHLAHPLLTPEEQIVWSEYAADPHHLTEAASAIRSALALLDPRFVSAAAVEEEEGQLEAPEGRLLTRLHRFRERDRRLVREKKEQALAQRGHLQCETCNFDFEDRYGARGRGFIECHHTRPVHTLRDGDKTKLADLALVCANCHRIIHATRPWLSMGELRTILGATTRSGADAGSCPAAEPAATVDEEPQHGSEA